MFKLIEEMQCIAWIVRTGCVDSKITCCVDSAIKVFDCINLVFTMLFKVYYSHAVLIYTQDLVKRTWWSNDPASHFALHLLAVVILVQALNSLEPVLGSVLKLVNTEDTWDPPQFHLRSVVSGLYVSFPLLTTKQQFQTKHWEPFIPLEITEDEAT